MRCIRLDRVHEMKRTFDNAVRCAEEAAFEVPAELVDPYDGQPALRPHTIEGWWQVWSGSVCIALLTPEDVAPLRTTPQTSVAPKEKP